MRNQLGVKMRLCFTGKNAHLFSFICSVIVVLSVLSSNIYAQQTNAVEESEGEQAFLSAVLYFGNNEFENALFNLDRSVKLGYMNQDTYLLMGICNLHLEAPLKAKESFDLYISQDTTSENMNVVGKVYYAFNMFDQAKTVFLHAIERDPENAALYSNLGSILIEKQFFEEAMACFDKAIKLDPNLSEAYLNLGILYFMMEDLESAEASFLKTIELNQKADKWDPIAYANLGDLYFVRRQLDDCIKAYTIVLNMDPGLSEVRTRLGMALQFEGQEALAKEQYELAISLGAAPSEAHSSLGNIIRREGKIYEAMCEFRKAIHLSGRQDPEPLIALAELLTGIGRFKEALKTLKEAYDLGMTGPQVVADLSRLNEKCGNEMEAVKYFNLLENGNVTDPVVLFETAKLAVESNIEGIYDPKKSIRISRDLAEKAEWKHPGILELLALGYAKIGDYEHAVELENLAIIAMPEGNPLIKPMMACLERYQKKNQ